MGELLLLVEDDPNVSALVSRRLNKAGYEVEISATAEAALDALSRGVPSTVCLDIELPGMSGLDALTRIRENHPNLPVIIMTADANVSTAVHAMQLGAYDYLTKPVDFTKLTTTVRNAVERYQMSMRISHLEREVENFDDYAGIIGRSNTMKALFRQIDRVAASDVTVLIHGESGTGKELIARALHSESERHDKPFVAINCAAIPENLEESVFFGHEKGAFTGADSQRKGHFEEADGGTLFMDEIAELPLSLQAKLLRALQERSFRRVGGNKNIKADFRLVTASHKDIRKEVDAGLFREDLYYRIAVFEMEVPSLRARASDIPLIAEAFAKSLSTKVSANITPEAMSVLQSYAWPGNVRELQNAIQRALVVCHEDIAPGDLPPRVLRGKKSIRPEATIARLDELEKAALVAAIDRANGNLSEVVRQLGIGRTTVYRKMKKYGIANTK